MRKYDLRKIMKRAHAIKRENKNNIWSLCLKMAWEEAKNPVAKSEKLILIDKLNKKAAEANSYDNGYHYNVYISNWENYEKSRTCFSIYETRDHSKHNKKISYGYYDNINNLYYPEKYKDLRDNFTVSGAAI